MMDIGHLNNLTSDTDFVLAAAFATEPSPNGIRNGEVVPDVDGSGETVPRQDESVSGESGEDSNPEITADAPDDGPVDDLVAADGEESVESVTESAEQNDADPVDAEPVDAESVHTEPGDTEPGDVEPGDVEMVDESGGVEKTDEPGAEVDDPGDGEKVDESAGVEKADEPGDAEDVVEPVTAPGRGGNEIRLLSRPLGSAPLLDSEPLPATRPGMLRPRPPVDPPVVGGYQPPAAGTGPVGGFPPGAA
ncbi:hypothetical protein [Actinoplanes sp. G11-F43]|uniref:hypothetical protein n=1 Tax=Actinoplanes sp. G11-F43 TaxID=3424130 RepID=UPI003D3383F9